MEQKPITNETTRGVDTLRISTRDPDVPDRPDTDAVIVESPLSIDVVGAGAYTLMCMPADARALAVGFLKSEGMIDGLDDILALSDCADTPGVLQVWLADPSKATNRNLVVASSCGLCGSENTAEMLAALPQVDDTLRVPAALLADVVEDMRRRQEVFELTGAAHAAAIFAPDGRIISFAEDIGRHNALDKSIGACILQGQLTAGCGVALSGRVSLELVIKCARAGLELISAVSAPTSLAIDAAAHARITLCAFVRESRATVYTCPERVSTGA
jgi:FdhD protein